MSQTTRPKNANGAAPSVFGGGLRTLENCVLSALGMEQQPVAPPLRGASRVSAAHHAARVHSGATKSQLKSLLRLSSNVFCEDRGLENQFRELLTHNVGLYKLICDLSVYVLFTCRKPLVVTCVHRNAEEQRKAYEHDPHPELHTSSPHMRWEAVDLRWKIFNNLEVDEITAALRTYDEFNKLKRIPASGSKTVLVHEVAGGAMHFHVQFRGNPVESLFRSDRVPFLELWNIA